MLHFDAYKRRYSVRPRGTRNGSVALANMFALQAIPCLLIQATGSARINTRVFRGHEQSDLWDPTFFNFISEAICNRRTMQKSNQGPSEYNSCLPGTQNIFTSAADGHPGTHPTTVLATSIQRTVHAPGQQTPSQSDCPSVAKPHQKPNCSYTVLIGMALKASNSGTLPVGEIYKYIE